MAYDHVRRALYLQTGVANRAIFYSVFAHFHYHSMQTKRTDTIFNLPCPSVSQFFVMTFILLLDINFRYKFNISLVLKGNLRMGIFYYLIVFSICLINFEIEEKRKTASQSIATHLITIRFNFCFLFLNNIIMTDGSEKRDFLINKTLSTLN